MWCRGGVKEPLQLDVQQRGAADEILETAAEIAADLAEDQPVIEEQERLPDLFQPMAAVPALAVVVIGQAQRPAEQRLHAGALLLDAFLDVLAEVPGQGRGAQQDGGPDLADVLRDVLQRLQAGLSLLHRGQGGAVLHHGVDAAGMGEGMVPGQDEQGHVARRAGDEGVGLLDVGRIVAVGENDALGLGGRSRRVADGGVVALAHGLPAVGELPFAAGQEFAAQAPDVVAGQLVLLQVLRGIEGDGFFQFRQVVLYLPDLGQLAARHHRQPAARVGKAELEFRQLVDADRYGDVHRPGEEDAELAPHPVGAAFGDEGDAIPFADAEAHEPGAEALRLLAHFGIGDPLVARPPFFPKQDAAGKSLNALDK